jgi:enoyl-CoA hydratase/carnithine racemase
MTTIERGAEGSPGRIHLHREGGIARLVIDNPARRNSMDLALRDVFHDLLAEALEDPEVRVLILRGAGGHFCAGGDVQGMQETAVECRARLQRLHRIVRLIAFAEKPVIAATEGVVAGNGLSFAAASDIVVTASDARFISAFVRIGLVPDTGALWLLPRRMGLGRAKLLMMSGKPMSGSEAVASGLADVETEPGGALARAEEIAADLMKVAPLAVGMTKALIARNPETLDEALKAEIDAQAVLFTTEDFAEGRAAFAEKRPPDFKAR